MGIFGSLGGAAKAMTGGLGSAAKAATGGGSGTKAPAGKSTGIKAALMSRALPKGRAMGKR